MFYSKTTLFLSTAVLLIFALFNHQRVVAQTTNLAVNPSPVELRMKQVVTSYSERGLFHGVLQVNRNGQVLLQQSSGFANYQWQIPNGPDVRYLLASVSKQFTAAGALR
jgi:CubicO group peptidase (beta-lactamase class C family)